LDAIIKVGGSLAENPQALKGLGNELCRLSKRYALVVVPGGGKFADVVRVLDANFSLPPIISHQMAILAMDQYGLFLSKVIPESITCQTLAEAKRLSAKRALPILLPSKLLSHKAPFVPSWDVTSDSISAYIAVKLNACKVIFTTDVDGIFSEDPRCSSHANLLAAISAGDLLELGTRTSVDKFLPELLKKNPIDCYVVNGFHSERVGQVLSEKPFIGTRIQA
jgi:5-(aminomethyl)-3-furanmethanol phosphate kinase